MPFTIFPVFVPPLLGGNVFGSHSDKHGRRILINVEIDDQNIATIHMYSGITSGRVLDGELPHTKTPEVNLFAFASRLFNEDFSPIIATLHGAHHSFSGFIYINLVGILNG